MSGKLSKDNSQGGVGVTIVGPYYPVIGGTSTFLGCLVSSLERAGICCEVLNSLKGDARLGYMERLKRFVFFLELSYRVACSDFKVVHIHAVNWANLLGQTIVMVAARCVGKRVVLTLHAGDLPHKFSSGVSRWISYWVLRIPLVITAVTPDLREIVVALRRQSVYFIPNDVLNITSRQYTSATSMPIGIVKFIRQHSPLMVLTGAMERIHGLEILIQALGILRKQFSRIGAIIISYKSVDTQYKAEIGKMLVDLDLIDSVLFPEPLTDVLAVVATGDIFVRPTFSDGDSIAIREALALGIPVLASNVGYRPPNVTLFPVGDYRALSSRIIETLTLNVAQKEISTTNDSRTSVVDQYVTIYRNLYRL